MPRPALERLAAAVVVATLALGLLLAIRRWAVDVPSGDSWELVPLLAAWRDGRLGLAGLWPQHNEHRIVFPRLAMLLLATVSGWSALWEIGANVALAGATLALLAVTLRLTVAPRWPTLARGLTVVAAAFTFSLVQWENWTWGWQMSVFLNAWAAAAAFARWPGRWRAFGVAFGAAIVGAFSFASGIVLLWLVPAAFVAQRGAGVRAAAATFALAAALTAAYFHGYVSPAGHPSPSLALDHPARAVGYALAYLGGPLVRGDETRAAIAYGALGATVFAVAVAGAWRTVPAARDVLVPWAFVAGFVLASAVVSAIGRSGMGTAQALASRYTTITGLFWIATLALAALAVASRGRPTRSVAIALVALGVALGAGWVRGYAGGVHGFRWRAARLWRGQACLRHYATADDACLGLLYPMPLRERAAALEAMRLGPFGPRAGS